MQYAHDRGILHRDLKPANILLTPSGEPKISDFGLAKRLDAGESGKTLSGTILGTANYMPPEQARGVATDFKADQYSVGAILYEMLVGRPPFAAPSAHETIFQVIFNEPVAPRQLQSKIPVDLETICLKALHKDANRRYANCTALADDIRRFINGEPILAGPIPLRERAWRWCRRNPRLAGTVVLNVAKPRLLPFPSPFSLTLSP